MEAKSSTLTTDKQPTVNASSLDICYNYTYATLHQSVMSQNDDLCLKNLNFLLTNQSTECLPHEEIQHDRLAATALKRFYSIHLNGDIGIISATRSKCCIQNC